MREKLALSARSFVVEIASNDGYLLKNFVAAGIPCLGIEPTASTARVAEELGIPTMREFFGSKVAERVVLERGQADLILGNNVYAHVPDINDFTDGLKIALKRRGTITLEFPHLLRLVEYAQFDTAYHEHFSYFSLRTVCTVFEHCSLRVWDVEQLDTHGGSLRIYGCHTEDPRGTTDAVRGLLAQEETCGLRDLSIYEAFQERADHIKNDLVHYLIEQKRAGRTVAAYGAAAKGNTLLNYAGIKPDLLPYVCDAAPSKQGKYLPGSHIPILAPAELQARRPEVILVLPWNIADEVIAQNAAVREWGGAFVVAVPELRVLG
jgi:hypothetical protein